ncbi:MAG TPA: pilus assembly protein [Devosiaceae bacterium]|nr:pilus assembly protein [Devosiaceae bacterium]
MPAPQSAQRKTVAVFSADRALRTRLTDTVKSLGRFAVSDDEPGSFLGGAAPRQRADVVILDIGDGQLLDDPRLGPVKDQMEKRPLIVISEPLSPERIRGVVRLQAADWLQNPFSDEEFAASLRQVEGVLAGEAARVSAFIGVTGGAGATTLALMAAHSLARKSTPGAVGIVDLDFQSSSCSSYLNLSKEVDLEALLANPDRLDGELLDLIKLERAPGISVYSFERPDLFFAPNAARFVLRLLDQAALKHREVLIDLPNLNAPWFDDVVRHSDHVFVVFEAHVPSLRQARRTVQHILEIRGSAAGITPIVNKAAFKLFGNAITRSDVGKMIGNAKFQVVSRDDDLTTEALNRALIPSEISPRARMVKEAGQVFQEVFGK